MIKPPLCFNKRNMLFSQELEGLHGDGSERSINERQIFTELFLESDTCGRNQRCFGTGVINFECNDTKQVAGAYCSNNINSALTRPVVSWNSQDDSGKKHGKGFGSEDLTLSIRRGPDMGCKRLKMSIDESDNKPCPEEVLDLTGPLDGIHTQQSQSTSFSTCDAVTCHLVESSSQGLASSCYLFKRRVGMSRSHGINDRIDSQCKVSAVDENDKKEIAVSKAVASPVSQESCATKILVAPPPVTVKNHSVLVRPTKPRWKDYCFLELDEADFSLPRNLKNDPRPLLRYHVIQLLRAAGWVIGRRKRNNKSNMTGEFVYKSPLGRPIREFHRAWSLCRDSLFADENNIMQEKDCKEWTSVAQLLSDLSNAAIEIEKQLRNLETTTTLAHLWCLLDPFATVVFIKKTIRLLKEGKAVKAKRKIVIHPYGKCEAVFCTDAMQTYPSEKKYMGPLETVNGSAAKSRNFSNHQRISLYERSLQTCETDNSCDGNGICLYEAPVSPGNAQTSLGGPGTVSPHEDSNRSSLTCEKERSENNDEFPLRSVMDVSMIHVKEEEHIFDLKPNPEQWECMAIGSNCTNNVSAGASTLRKKVPKKSKKISEIKLSNLYQNDKFGTSTSGGEPHLMDANQELSGSRKTKACHLKDDDLLISAIIKNKTFKSPNKSSIRRSKSLRKRKSHKGSCKLLPQRVNRGGKHFIEGKWSIISQRTVLSWLIHSGVLSLNEVIQYRNPKDETVVKDGFVTRDGILCKCCNEVLSISEFKSHAGFRSNRPCLNLIMESGKPFTLCQLEAWSAEYKAKKGAPRTVLVEEIDENDDSCGRCGDGGELICCDNCPSTFHQACLYTEELPEGNWYCPQCTCPICGDLVNEKEESRPPSTLKCLQCEFKYHEACAEAKGLKCYMTSDTWFCSGSCQEVYSGLQSRIGLLNFLSDDFSWSLLKCIHGDQKVHSAQRFVALKADCNSKLAVSLTIMEECFLPMVDPRTGIDMIPHVVYNWGSQFARLNYYGFYTVVLEKDDIVMSVASIRIHGTRVAEMPLIATCSKYRRQGMCRRLINAIEAMLESLKVEKLVISAIPGLVETWTEGFGFEPLEDFEKRSLSDINLMVFPGTVWLKKPLFGTHRLGQKADDSIAAGGGSCTKSGQHSDKSPSLEDGPAREYPNDAGGGKADEECRNCDFKEEEADIGGHFEEFEQGLDQNLPTEAVPGGEDAAFFESENSALEEEDQDLGGGMHDEVTRTSTSDKQDTFLGEEVSCVVSLDMVHDKTILFRQTFPENQCTTLQGNGE